ncbi:von Willebrand factor type A domain-containing protein [Aquihabitans sp. G128]|uniref:vWA domain-containing protein n=1 Tax=Aquihabitans sp. G128 TaxID=2849779 RepID=UPI001C246962|nr:von Willebrand factor type A domain-containing protein [Aquihabitans sp. G128]QXC59725.1 von Willebrand factor type A domain-containing protein [Aquihabitans sp. G128]
MTPRRALPALALAVALVAGCSSEAASPPTTVERGKPYPTADGKPRVDLDPERYVTGYPEQRAGSAGGPMTNASPTASGGGVAYDQAEGPVAPRPPTIYEDNTFVGAGHHPFVTPKAEPTSTFGLDVDTGSFSVGRTFLSEGTLPPPDSVRTEEWVNALGSQQEAPSDAIGVAVDTAPSALDDTRLVRVGVAGRDLSVEDRPPANLTFVVDTSGSMDIRERLGLVKASLGLLVLNLRDDDTIAIVQYSDEAGVVLEPTPVKDAKRIVDAIDELQPSNSTNLEAGLRAGYRQAQEAFRKDGLNAVILASDGVANVGLTDPDGLAGVISDRAEQGIHLVTVGYGMGNYNDDLMEQVADQGDGFYAYLDTYAQAEKLFRDRLTSTLSVVAQDAKAQVRFDPAMVSSYRLLGYENRALAEEDFDDASVDAGEIGAGHRVTALYEVRLAKGADDLAPDSVLGGAKVRYVDGASGKTVTAERPVVLGGATKADQAPDDLRFQAATAAFAEWLASQPAGGPSGDPEGPVIVEDDVDGPTTTTVPSDDATPVEPGSQADLEAIIAEAESAAKGLPAAGLPGSVVTPEAMLDLMRAATKATPSPTATYAD